MNIIMAGIDYSLADLDTREKFSIKKSSLEEIYKKILEVNEIKGSVIITTCNRTEIYLSCIENFYVNPFELLCKIINKDFEDNKKIIIRKSTDVMVHLCQLACGVKSQIWGEDQIISQVKNSINEARELGATDSILEVMFRNSISAAKKIKTTLNLNKKENSVIYKTVELIEKNNISGNILVIGNGEIGRNITQELVKKSYPVTMTLRHYRHAANIVPKNADTIDYIERYICLENSDAVISATSSPHFTIMYDELLNFKNLPKLFVDLAVPRDIEPEIETLINSKIYNIDSLCKNEIDENHTKKINQVNEIIKKYIFDFENWYNYREGIVLI